MPTTATSSQTVPGCVCLEANSRGRDFIASDLHGCHAALMHALEAAHFDPAAGDRLLLGGDLIDRGAESLACLRLLREPWVHACLGNHEAMLLTWLERRHSDCHDVDDFTDNGGQWAEHLLESASRRELVEFSELATLVEQLPLVLSVDDTVMPFNVSHGDLRPLLAVRRTATGCKPTPQERLHQLRRVGGARADAAVWSRALAYELEDRRGHGTQARLAGDSLIVSGTPVERGLALSYVGHTTMPAFVLHRSRLFIDRGAAYASADEPAWRLALVQHRPVAQRLASLVPALSADALGMEAAPLATARHGSASLRPVCG